MDINPDNLARIEGIVKTIIEKMDKPKCKVTATMDRREALTGADGVLCTVFNGDIDIWEHDILIPKKYGVDTNVGDTRSVSGIFRALRNIPLMLEICRDIEECCPRAVFLNYTNPMAMLCGAMQKYSNVEVTGLCHSVQGTVKMLSEWLDIPMEEITYKCMGVNHQAFYTVLEHNGEDLYPRLRKLLEDPKFMKKELVRNEMILKLGYYVTESSGHNSEYNQWFRKRPELIEKYCTHGTGWNPGLHAYSLNLRLDREARWREQLESWLKSDIDINRGLEYAAPIFNARFGDHTPFTFNGNVINNGAITNLPQDACVEVPCLVDRGGLHPMTVGKLPPQLAIMINNTALIENLVVEACMEKNKSKVKWAVCHDPLTSAVCSLEEINQMCDELFEINKEFLGDYK
jgi:alpha-galactosidase